MPCFSWKSNAITGSILAIVSGILLALQSTFINTGLQFGLQLREGSRFYKEWQDTTDLLSVWIWNVTNADKFTLDRKSGRDSWSFPVPEVEQVGPFIFEQHYVKDHIRWFDNNEEIEAKKSKTADSVKFRQTYSYRPVFNKNDKSTGLDPETTLINPGNLVTLALPNIIEYICDGFSRPDFKCSVALKSLLRTTINQLYSASGTLPVLGQLPATKFIWKYEDPLLTELINICKNNPICAESPVPELLPPGIGLLWVKNTTLAWNNYHMETGKNNIDNYLNVKEWSGHGEKQLSEKLTVWPENGTCNDIRGTDGHTSFPKMSPEKNQWIFSQDLFRSFDMDFWETGKSPVYDLEGLKYKIQKSALAAPVDNPENSCVCTPFYWSKSSMDCMETAGGYVADGALGGIPLLVTLPHFLWAEDWMSGRVKGDFTPNWVEHGLYVNYHKLSGLPLTADDRFQFSLAVTEDRNYNIFRDMDSQTTIMPLIWVNESFIIPEAFEKIIWSLEVVMLTLYTVLASFGVGLGLLLVGYSIYQQRNLKDVEMMSSEKVTSPCVGK